MSDPERLRPGESGQALTERAAATFAELARSLRDRGHAPQAVAHFVNGLVFCMFAEDVGLLPDDMFTRMLEHSRSNPEEFAELARALFGAVGMMAMFGLMNGSEAMLRTWSHAASVTGTPSVQDLTSVRSVFRACMAAPSARPEGLACWLDDCRTWTIMDHL